jgi:hypothetical protein
VVRNTFHRFLPALRREECGDLVRHIDKSLVRRHGQPSRRVRDG